MEVLWFTLVLAGLFCLSNGETKFPPIKNCEKNDNRNKCIVDNTNRMLPYLATGVKEWDIPSIDPYSFPATTVIQTSTLTFNVSSGCYFGLPNCRVINASLNEDTGFFYMEFFCKYVYTVLNYSLEAQEYGRHVIGKGPGLFINNNVTVTMNANFYLKERDNRHFIIQNSTHVSMRAESITLFLTGLTDSLGSAAPEINNYLQGLWPEYKIRIEKHKSLLFRRMLLTVIKPLIARFSIEELLGNV